MGLITGVKDAVFDAVGIYDDVRDFIEFVDTRSRELTKRGKILTKLLDEARREVEAAEYVDELKNFADSAGMRVIKELREEVDEGIRGLKNIQGKIKNLEDQKNRDRVSSVIKEKLKEFEKMADRTAKVRDQILKAAKETRELLKYSGSERPTEVAKRRRRQRIIAKILGSASAIAAFIVFRTNW